MGEGDGAWAMRTGRGREHAHRHGPVDGGQARATLVGQMRRSSACEPDRMNQRDELIARGRTEKSDLRIAFGARFVLADDRDRRHAVYRELLGLVPIEDEIHFLDGDLVGKSWQLIENLPGLQTRFAVERLCEEDDAHRSGHLRQVLTEPFLIAWRKKRHGYLKRSSNAWRALGGPAGVPVCRSTVVRASNSAQVLRSSFGEIRAAI